MESILTSVKKYCGIAEEYTHFDTDLIMHINSVLFVLTQLGVGPSNGFTIEDEVAEWTDFVDRGQLEAVKSYVCMKVRLIFDPPQSSAHMDAMKNLINEFEWRLNVVVDPGEEEIQNGV